MKIIPDTNVWYRLGANQDILQQVIGHPITPTLINLKELTLSGALVEREDSIRKAIQAMLGFRDNMIVDDPYMYLAKNIAGYQANNSSYPEYELAIAERFATGGSIAQEHLEEFHLIIGEKREAFQAFADFSNNQLARIREQVGSNKKDHRNEDTLELTSRFIDMLVRLCTKDEANLIERDLNQCELLIRTADYFFKRMETTDMAFQGNDFYDLSQLAYVQPGDKFWTFERRWRSLIIDAGMSEYLYAIPGASPEQP